MSDNVPARARRGLNGNPRPRGGKPPEFGKDSRPRGDRPADDRTLKTGSGVPPCELVRPSWNGKTGTVLRLLPNFDHYVEDRDVLAHGRRDADFTDWIRGYEAVKYVGIGTKVTFLLGDANRERSVDNPNPYVLLERAVRNAVEQESAKLGSRNVLKASWSNLVHSRKRKAFNRPTWLYYVQAAIYIHNGRTFVRNASPPRGLGRDDKTQIVELSKTAAEELLRQLEEQKEVFNGGLNDPERYTWPDPTSLADGPFVYIYNASNHPETPGGVVDAADNRAAAEVEEEQESARTGTSGGDGDISRWNVSLLDTVLYTNENKRYRAKRDLQPYRDVIESRTIWWDNVIHVPSTQEQVIMLAAAFRDDPDILRFGWKDHPEWFDDEVEGLLRSRTAGPGAEVPAEDDEVGDDEVVEETTPRSRSATQSRGIPNRELADEDSPVAEMQERFSGEDADETADDSDEASDLDEAAMAAAMQRAQARAAGLTQPAPKEQNADKPKTGGPNKPRNKKGGLRPVS